MYIYVQVQPAESYCAAGPSGGLVKARLEAASGEPCLIVPYEKFDLAGMRRIRPRAVVMSGFGNRWQTYDVAGFRGMVEVLHNADLPILCICGSHQLLGFAFNRDISRIRRLHDEPMRRIGPREDFPRVSRSNPRYDMSGYFAAIGFFPITRLRPDPLFAGLPRTMIMKCSHYCEVKRLPPGFVRLAQSGHCRIEAMRHTARPLYGVQFHPEQFDAPWFHGRTLLDNFAGIVRRHWRAVTPGGSGVPRGTSRHPL